MILKLSKLLFLVAVVIIAGAGFLRADNTNNAVYGFLSETYSGLDYDTMVATDTDAGYMSVWSGDGEFAITFAEYLPPYFSEGSQAMGFTTSLTNGGWGGGFSICFGNSGPGGSGAVERDKNMSAYAGGTVEFDIWLSTFSGQTPPVNNATPIVIHPSDIHLKLGWGLNANGAMTVSDDQTLGTLCPSLTSNPGWQHCSISLSSFKNVSKGTYFDNLGTNDGIKHADEMDFGVNIAPTQFFIDNLVLKKPTPGTFYPSLIDRYSGLPVSNLTFPNVLLGTTTWSAADQCIKVRTDYFDVNMSSMSGRTWGIQIYTDNKNGGYTGTGDPVGLVNQDVPTQTLPMCWRIVGSTLTTQNLAIVQARAQVELPSDTRQYLYSQYLGGAASNFPCFLWMKDKNSPGFINSDDYVTVWNSRGIQYSESGWSGVGFPNYAYIYIEADFTNAKTPCHYNTNTLTLELFHD
jgi:hypothetical protein